MPYTHINEWNLIFHDTRNAAENKAGKMKSSLVKSIKSINFHNFSILIANDNILRCYNYVDYDESYNCEILSQNIETK